MANHWAARDWQVTLLTYDDGSVPPAYDLRKDVVRRPLGIAGESMNLAQAMANNVKRLTVLREAIRDSDPDVVISFLDSVNVRTILACVGCGVPVIVSEHSDPGHHPIGWVWSALRRCVYPCAAAVVALTKDALGFFPWWVRRKGLRCSESDIVADRWKVLGWGYTTQSRYGYGATELRKRV